jgi:hypothetical protein
MSEETTETTIPIAPPATSAPAPATEEIRAVAVHKNFAWEVRSVDFNVSATCFRRADIVKIFAREFSRPELLAKRIGMKLTAAEGKYLELWNAAAEGENQRLGKVVVRLIESSPDDQPPIAS